MSVILSAAAALLWLPRPGCPYPHFSAPTWLLQWDKAWSVPSLHTTTCSLSEKSICSLAAASRLAQVIPKTTSLERTSGCTLHKLNLGLHLRRNRHCGLTLEVQIRCFHSNILAGKWYLYIYISAPFALTLKKGLNQHCHSFHGRFDHAEITSMYHGLHVWNQRESKGNNLHLNMLLSSQNPCKYHPVSHCVSAGPHGLEFVFCRSLYSIIYHWYILIYYHNDQGLTSSVKYGLLQQPPCLLPFHLTLKFTDHCHRNVWQFLLV